MSKEKLTRDSELYEEVMRNKVINNSEFESEFTGTVDLDYTIDYECDLWWKSLDEKEYFSNISISRLIDLQSMSEVRLAEECGKSLTSHTWRATGDVKFEVEVKYVIKLPDSETVVAVTSLDLNSGRDKRKAEGLVSSIVNEESVDVTLEDGLILINTGENVFKSDLVEEFDDYGKDRSDQLINYLASEGLYVSSKIEDPRHEDNRVYIPVTVGDAKLEFAFDEPESNQDFWEIADLYGEGDPLLMANSEVFVCLNHLDDSSDNLMEDGLFTVHTEPKNSLTRNILGTLNLGRVKSKTNALLNSFY